jgi:hypothetical protein
MLPVKDVKRLRVLTVTRARTHTRDVRTRTTLHILHTQREDTTMTNTETDEIPVLPAIDTGQHFKVWCRHCRRWHWHGREEGHRVAHCDNWTRGYVLRLIQNT